MTPPAISPEKVMCFEESTSSRADTSILSSWGGALLRSVSPTRNESVAQPQMACAPAPRSRSSQLDCAAPTLGAPPPMPCAPAPTASFAPPPPPGGGGPPPPRALAAVSSQAEGYACLGKFQSVKYEHFTNSQKKKKKTLICRSAKNATKRSLSKGLQAQNQKC